MIQQHRVFIDVAFVAIVGGAFAALIVVALRQAFRTPGRPKGYSGEHVGADEKWSPKADVRNAPPGPKVPLKVLLAEAEEEFVRAHDKVARLRQAVADEEDDRYIAELRAIGNAVTGQLQRVGHLESHTVEIDRAAFLAGAEAGWPVGAGHR